MKLTKFLTSPTQIAKKLDWNKLNSNVLALKISRQHVGLTVAPHPLSLADDTTMKTDNNNHNFGIDPIIPLNFTTISGKKILDSSVITRLHSIIQTHNICGFIVSWPLEKEGRIGANCGRVLYTLDAILEATSSEEEGEPTIFSNSRKFCLWDESHVKLEHDDSFGRCSIFGTPKYISRKNHVSQREPYKDQQIIAAAADAIWMDFRQRHWPRENNNKMVNNDTDDLVFDGEWLDDVFDEQNESIRI